MAHFGRTVSFCANEHLVACNLTDVCDEYALRPNLTFPCKKALVHMTFPCKGAPVYKHHSQG